MFNKTKLIISHLTILVGFIFGNPSEGVWKQYLYTDGISSNYIFDVYKDRKDRVWIGTQNGITLLDGSNTRKYLERREYYIQWRIWTSFQIDQ